MPFTLGGDWVPSEDEATVKKTSRPVKVRSERRKKSFVTLVLNLSFPAAKLEEIARTIKQTLGCGGSLKNGVIEIQGKKEEEVRKILKDLGIKAQ